MSSRTIVTLAAGQTLRKRGFTEDRATGVVEVLRESDASALATKSDIRELELSMTIKLGVLIVAATGINVLALRYLPVAHP